MGINAGNQTHFNHKKYYQRSRSTENTTFINMKNTACLLLATLVLFQLSTVIYAATLREADASGEDASSSAISFPDAAEDENSTVLAESSDAGSSTTGTSGTSPSTDKSTGRFGTGPLMDFSTQLAQKIEEFLKQFSFLDIKKIIDNGK